MFERALDGKKVIDSDMIVRGFSCLSLDCLAEATGCADEVE